MNDNEIENHPNLPEEDLFKPEIIGDHHWESLSQEEQKNLIDRFGNPLTIPNTKFSTSDVRQTYGTCPANEKSILALIRERIQWGRYELTIINNSIILYYLGGQPRMLSTRLIIGEDGGIIIPGFIYTETQSPSNPNATLGSVSQKGLLHEAHRGSFTTAHIGNTTNTFNLIPLRRLDPTKNIQVQATEPNSDSLKSLILWASLEATEPLEEDQQYQKIKSELPRFFSNPKNTIDITLTKPLLLSHEIDTPFNTIKDNKPQTVLKAGTIVKATIDPVSFHNHGVITYIFEYNDSYYFCPDSNAKAI